MRWTRHAQCNDQSCDNIAYSMLWTTMAYSMLNGLKPRWIGLSHAQLSGHWDELKTRNTKHACTMHWPIQEAQEHNSQECSKSDKCASVKTLSALKLSKKWCQIIQTKQVEHARVLRHESYQRGLHMRHAMHGKYAWTKHGRSWNRS